MRQLIFWSALAVVFLAGEAKAQPPGPPRTSPTVSPYINLTRNGNSPGLNYYGLVRPQISAQQSIQGLQTQVNQNAMNIGGLQQQGNTPTSLDGSLSATGFRVGYMTHYAYFLNSGSGRGGGGGIGGGGIGGGGIGGGGIPSTGGRSTPSFGGGSGGIGSGMGGGAGLQGGGGGQTRPPRR